MVYAGNFYYPIYPKVGSSSSTTTSAITTTGISPTSNTYQQQQQRAIDQQRASSEAQQLRLVQEQRRSGLAPVPFLQYQQQRQAQLKRQELLDELTVSPSRPSYNLAPAPVSRVVTSRVHNNAAMQNRRNPSTYYGRPSTSSNVVAENLQAKYINGNSQNSSHVQLLGPTPASPRQATTKAPAWNPLGSIVSDLTTVSKDAQSSFAGVQNYFANSATQLYAAGAKNLQQGKQNNNFLQYELGGVIPEYGAGALQMTGYILGKTGNVPYTPYTVLGGIGSIGAQFAAGGEAYGALRSAVGLGEPVVDSAMAAKNVVGFAPTRALIAARAGFGALVFGSASAGLSWLNKGSPTQIAENFGLGALVGAGSEIGAEYLPRIGSAVDERLDITGRVSSAANRVGSLAKGALRDIDQSTMNLEDFASGSKNLAEQGVSDLRSYPQSLRDLDTSLDSSLRNVTRGISNKISEPFYRLGLKPPTEHVDVPNYDFSDLKGFYDTSSNDMFRAEYNIARRLRPSEGPLRPNAANSSLENASNFFSNLDRNLGKDVSQITTKSGQVLLQVPKVVAQETKEIPEELRYSIGSSTNPLGILEEDLRSLIPSSRVVPKSSVASRNLFKTNPVTQKNPTLGGKQRQRGRFSIPVVRATPDATAGVVTTPDQNIGNVPVQGQPTTPTSTTTTTPRVATEQLPQFLQEEENQQAQEGQTSDFFAPFPLFFAPGQQTGERKNYTRKEYGQGLNRNEINLNPFSLGESSPRKKKGKSEKKKPSAPYDFKKLVFG